MPSSITVQTRLTPRGEELKRIRKNAARRKGHVADVDGCNVVMKAIAGVVSRTIK
jgi:hypothetical protein